MELINLEKAFKNHTFRTEEDVKIHFHADIVEPLLKELNPARANQYRSEDTLLAGRAERMPFQF